VRESVVAGRGVDTAAITFTLRDGTAGIEGDVVALAGSATVVASARPFDDTVTFRIDPLRFRQIALDTVVAAGDPAPGPSAADTPARGGETPARRVPAVALSGTLVADGALPPGAFPNITSRVVLDPTPINDGELRRGRIDLVMNSGSARAEGMLETGEGHVEFRGSTRLVRNDSGAATFVAPQASGLVRLPDLAALVGRSANTGRLDATFRLDADSLSARADAWRADILASGSWDEAVLDTLRTSARVVSDVLYLDTLVLHSNVATGGGAGVLALNRGATPPDTGGLHLFIEADSGYAIGDALRLEQFSLRRGALTIDARNARGGIDATGRLLVRGLITPGVWADSLIGTGAARIEERRLLSATARLDGIDAGTGRFDVESLTSTITWDSARMGFDVSLRRDGAHTARVAGSAVPRERAITLARMDLTVDSAAWALARPASVTWGARTTINDFDLVRGARRIVVDGTIDQNGTQDLTVRLDSVPLRGFAEFAGIDGLDGIFDGELHLTGPARGAALEGTLRLRMLGAAGSLVLAPAAGTLLDVRAEFSDSAGRPLRVAGTAPLRFSIAPGDSALVVTDGPLDLTVTADSFNVGWASPLVQPFGVRRIDGNIAADIRIGGTVEEPVTSGTGALARGRFEYPRQGVAYGNVNGRFAWNGDRIQVETLQLTAGGTATASGVITLETAANPRLNLRASFDRFRAARNEWVNLGVTGSMTVAGAFRAPVLVGNLTLVDTDILADPIGRGQGGKPIQLTEADRRMLAQYFGYRERDIEQPPRSIIAPWMLEVDVRAGTNTWLRKRNTPEIAILLDGSLDVRKASGDSIQMFGTVQAIPERSSFQQFGRTFRVTTGTVTFNGPLMGWRANFNASYDIPSVSDPSAPEATVTLAVRGTLSDLDLTLGSTPPMETADILSYLAVGRPAASAAEFGGGELAESLAAGQLAMVLEDAATRNVGLDVVEVRHSGLKGATIVAGRYVNPRLFVGFEQPLTLQSERDNETQVRQQSTEIHLEYRMYRWLMASLQGDQSNFRFLFRMRRAY
jgi:translocation and assembly module TamB